MRRAQCCVLHETRGSRHILVNGAKMQREADFEDHIGEFVQTTRNLETQTQT